ncbi:non-ribosomal peptide synthetase, partial [Xanthomonas sacchari]|uniref:non-ribosomal peptide synthetase n=1 Tax=Xanthomonas sacchari TaxID=56458 RepID=UPI00225B009D
MILQSLIARLLEKEISVSTDGIELTVRAAPGVLDNDTIALLKTWKQALIAALQDGTAMLSGSASAATKITSAMLPLIALEQEAIDRLVGQVPDGVGNVQDIYPLAPLQEGILFHHMLDTTGDAYLLRTVLGFEARPQLDAFLHALQIVIDRHDILRTAIHWRDLPQAVQLVQRRAPLPRHELGFLSLQELLAHTDPATQRLDLQRAPLLAAYIARDPLTHQWRLSLLTHHLVCDHITLEVIIAEIQAVLQGHADQLPPSLPYRNFIAHMRAVSTEAHETYFRQQLGDLSEPTAPFGLLAIRDDDTSPITEVKSVLPPVLCAQLRQLARQHGVSPAVLFHVAWAQVLHSCDGGREDVVFGTVLSGRMQGGAGVGTAVGLFINTLPLRISLTGLSVRDAVTQMAVQLGELLRHEQAPLTLAQRCSGVPATQPLFGALLNYRHSAPADTHPGALLGMELLLSEERTNYPVSMCVDDFGEQFGLKAICQGIAPERMLGYFQSAIEAVVQTLEQTPERPLVELDVLPAAERQQLLVDFNATARDYPHDRLIHQLFEEQAARTPQAIALVCDTQTLTYAELDARANRLAHFLIGLGVGPEDRIAVCLQRGPALIEAMFATLKSGAAYIPIDPHYPEDRLLHLLNDSAPKLVLTQLQLRDTAAYAPAQVVVMDAADTIEKLERHPVSNPLAHATTFTASRLAYVIYTSGSTGLPKGAMNHHRGLVNTIHDFISRFEIGPGHRMLQFASSSFDASIVEIMVALCSGAALRLIPTGKLLAGEALREVLADGITHALLSPTSISSLTENSKIGELQVLISCAEALAPSLAMRWAADYRLLNAYGPSETAICASTFDCTGMSSKESIIPIGKPFSNTQIYLLDAAQSLVPLGATGEIFISGVGVGNGYLNRPELTAERFLPDPFSDQPDARMYRTGDLGRWRPDGTLE